MMTCIFHFSGRENSIEEGVEKCQEEKKERTLIQDATLLLFCAGKALLKL
jgi:hypothetical protein